MGCATPSLGNIIGATSAIAATVLKIFKLIISGSIYGIRHNHFGGEAFPSLRTDRAQR